MTKRIKEHKLISFLLVLFIVLTILMCIINNGNKRKNVVDSDDNNNEVHVNNNFEIDNNDIDGIILDDVIISESNEETTIILNVYNKNDFDVSLSGIKIYLKNSMYQDLISYYENDELVDYLVGYVGGSIKSMNKKSISLSVDANICDEVRFVSFDVIK